MFKIFTLLFGLLLSSNIAFSMSINNTINKSEYPSSNEVPPIDNSLQNSIFKGSVSTSIDISLEECIKLALGNNPQISAAFNDILASDARVKQVWSNYFPQFSWQTGYTRLRQLQLSDALGENLELFVRSNIPSTNAL
jgi:outer membrane protein TolC